MVNILVKFVKNPKEDGKVIAFFRKKVCFVLNGSPEEPKEGEHWECFLWADRKKFFLIKPFKKIDNEMVKEEQERINKFNQELYLIEKQRGADFEKVVFDEKNRPYLLSKKSLHETRTKYKDYVVKEVTVKNVKQVWARPILNEEDRRDWRMNH